VRPGLRIEDGIDGGDDIVCAELRAVMKRHARTQLEGPFGQRRIRVPGDRQVRLDGHVRFQSRQVGVEQLGDEIFRVHTRQHRINDRRRLVDRHPQHTATLRSLGRGDPGQAADADCSSGKEKAASH
jgi:hypothetical protein